MDTLGTSRNGRLGVGGHGRQRDGGSPAAVALRSGQRLVSGDLPERPPLACSDYLGRELDLSATQHRRALVTQLGVGGYTTEQGKR